MDSSDSVSKKPESLEVVEGLTIVPGVGQKMSGHGWAQLLIWQASDGYGGFSVAYSILGTAKAILDRAEAVRNTEERDP